MNIGSNRADGRVKGYAVGEESLVALARVLSLLWAQQLSPPGAKLQSLGPQVQPGVCLGPDSCPLLVADRRPSG